MAGKFPRAYAEEAKEARDLMEYVDGGGKGFAGMGIGARSSGMPKGSDAPHSGGMSISHVGDTAGKK